MKKLIPLVSAALASILLTQSVYAQNADSLSYDKLPAIARDLITQAANTGDPENVNAVANATIGVLPTFKDSIEQFRAETLEKMAASGATSDSAQAILADAEEAGDDAAASAAQASEAVEIAAGTEEEAVTVKPGIFSLEPWTGKVAASALNASGNSNNTAIGFLLDASRETGKFTHNINGFYDRGSSNGITTQNRWGGSYRLDYAISDRWNAFARGYYEDDRFSGFDYTAIGTAGLGYFIRKSDPFTWRVDAGPGYRFSAIGTDPVTGIQLPGDDISEFALYGASDIDWVIREGLTFTSDIGVTWSSATTIITTSHGLNAALWGGLTAGVFFDYRNETNPPAGRVNDDTVLRASLGYSF